VTYHRALNSSAASEDRKIPDTLSPASDTAFVTVAGASTRAKTADPSALAVSLVLGLTSPD
jgi:hypothetical protein